MDPYFKKEIDFDFRGEHLKFDVAHTLFSTFDIDHGTELFLKTIDVGDAKKILDIGCGYGTIGLALAKKYPSIQVTMVDRDLLAVRYAQGNARKNNLDNVTILGSVGVEAVNTEAYDLIVSNIPAKIGDLAIEEEFLRDPYALVNPNGSLWVVVVTALNRIVPTAARRNAIPIHEVKRKNRYCIYKALKV